MKITRQARFFGTQEALDADMSSFVELNFEVGVYINRTQEWRLRDTEQDHRIYWRLINDDQDRRGQIAGMQFSHITFHHTCSPPSEIMFALSRLRFPSTLELHA